MTKIQACPSCGDQHHLYDRADARWNPEKAEWVIGDLYGQIECTNCDWSGSEGALKDD